MVIFQSRKIWTKSGKPWQRVGVLKIEITKPNFLSTFSQKGLPIENTVTMTEFWVELFEEVFVWRLRVRHPGSTKMGWPWLWHLLGRLAGMESCPRVFMRGAVVCAAAKQVPIGKLEIATAEVILPQTRWARALELSATSPRNLISGRKGATEVLVNF
jgi:hypothetical protein